MVRVWRQTQVLRHKATLRSGATEIRRKSSVTSRPRKLIALLSCSCSPTAMTGRSKRSKRRATTTNLSPRQASPSHLPSVVRVGAGNPVRVPAQHSHQGIRLLNRQRISHEDDSPALQALFYRHNGERAKGWSDGLE